MCAADPQDRPASFVAARPDVRTPLARPAASTAAPRRQRRYGKGFWLSARSAGAIETVNLYVAWAFFFLFVTRISGHQIHLSFDLVLPFFFASMLEISFVHCLDFK